MYPCFIILILPSFISLPQNIASTAMVAKNKVRYQAMAAIVKAVLNLTLAFPLSKHFGSLGMCIAITSAYFINVCITNVLYVKILKLNIALFFKATFGRFVLPIAAVLLLGWGINLVLRPESWALLFAKIAIFTTAYAIAVPYLAGSANRAVISSAVTDIIRRRNA